MYIHISCVEKAPIRISRKATYTYVSVVYPKKRRCKRIDIPFASQSDDSPIIAVFIRLFFDLGREGNSTHNPISKFLIQYGLVCVSVVLYNLVETVNQWLLGRHIHDLTTKWIACQLLAESNLIHAQDIAELFHIFGGCLGLAVEDSCDSYFVAAKLLCYVFKGEVLGCFCFEKSWGLNGEAVT